MDPSQQRGETGLVPYRFEIGVRHQPIPVPHAELDRPLEVIERQSVLAGHRVKASDVVQHQRIVGVGLNGATRPFLGFHRFSEELQFGGAE